MSPAKDRKALRCIVELDRTAPQGLCKPRAGVKGIEHDHRFESGAKLVSYRSEKTAELGQDAIDLAQLVGLQLTQPVAGLDCCWRLDEERPACARRVMHDSAYRNASFSPDRNYEATVPHCD